MTMFPTKFTMSVSLLIFRLFSFVTIREEASREDLGPFFCLFFCGEDVSSLDSWIYLYVGPLRLCWMYL
jgi:hypothetical protein